MNRIIEHPDGMSFSARDGQFWNSFEVDRHAHRVCITGWVGDGPQDWEPTQAVKHTPDEIDEIADRLKVMAARARGRA